MVRCRRFKGNNTWCHKTNVGIREKGVYTKEWLAPRKCCAERRKKKGKERAKQDSPSCLKAVVGSWWGFNFASAVAGS